MECWWAQPSSHDRSVHVHSCVRSVSGTQLMAAGWDFAETNALLGIWGDANIQDQLNGIVRNKAIYRKVATVLGPFSTLDPFSAASSTSNTLSSTCFSKCHAKLPVAQCHEYRHENEIYVSFFAVSYDSHMNRSRLHAFT